MRGSKERCRGGWHSRSPARSRNRPCRSGMEKTLTLPQRKKLSCIEPGVTLLHGVASTRLQWRSNERQTLHRGVSCPCRKTHSIEGLRRRIQRQVQKEPCVAQNRGTLRN